MPQKSKANLTSSLNIAITDLQQKQNTSTKVRGIIQDIIDSSINIVDGFSGGTSGDFLGYSGTTSGLTISGNYDLNPLLPTKFRTNDGSYENSLFFYGGGAASLISQNTGFTQYGAFAVANAIPSIVAQDYATSSTTQVDTKPTSHSISVSTTASTVNQNFNFSSGIVDLTVSTPSITITDTKDANTAVHINNIITPSVTITEKKDGGSGLYSFDVFNYGSGSQVNTGYYTLGFYDGFSWSLNNKWQLTMSNVAGLLYDDLVNGRLFHVDHNTGVVDIPRYAYTGASTTRHILGIDPSGTIYDLGVYTTGSTSNQIWVNGAGASSAIISGSTNATSGLNSVAIGAGNRANGANTFISGVNNFAGAGAANAIAGGQGNIITGTTLNSLNSFIGGGANILITASTRSNAVGTNTGTIANSSQSILLGGTLLTISGSVSNSAILGGNNNILTGSRSAIIGGQNIIGSLSDTVYVPNLKASFDVSGSSAYFTGSVNTNSVNSTTLTALGLVGGGNRMVMVDNAGVLSATNLPVQRIYKDITDSSTLSGTTTQTIVKSVLIPANTFTTGDVVNVKTINTKIGVGGACRVELLTNTSISLSGATSIGYFLGGTNNLYQNFERTITIKNNTTNSSVFNSVQTAINDFSVTSGSYSPLPIDWTVNQYIIIAHTNANAGDATNCASFIIEKH